jgi:Tol biopolymer transport system component
LPAPTPTTRPATVVYVQGKNDLHTLGLSSSEGQDIDLTLHEFAAAPAWSPDGSQVAFFGESGINQLGGIYGEGNGIWLVDVATRGVRQLVKIDHVKNINWSWDGNRLAFEVGPPGVTHQVVVVNANDGHELSRFPGEQPAWAPGDQRLVIKSCAPECGLWQVGTDGSGGRLLTNDSTDSYPAWSPDGGHLVFASRGRTGDWEIYRLNPEDKTLFQLTQRSGTDVTPVFSPDGREIYFRTDVAGSWQIRAINPEGEFERLVRDNVGPSDDWGLARPAVN